MSYHDTVSQLAQDAEQMEQVYRSARQAGEVEAFAQAIDHSYASAPENLLYAAWFYRLKHAAEQVKGFAIDWAWVVPLALINGLLFWWLSDDQQFMVRIAVSYQGDLFDYLPALLLLVAPLAATFVLVYLTVVGRKHWGLSAIVGALTLAAGAYVLLTYPQAGTRPFQEQYVSLMTMHLPLLAWSGVGLVLTVRHRDPSNRFAFLIKSLEVFIVGGLFVIAGGLFTAISVGLFEALDVRVPELVQRLFIAGGGGLIPVIATAIIYNPTVSPSEQAFDEGLSKLVALLMRILLPLALLVLLVYVFFIPFNFRAPFENRDVLIIYNGMLFAVVALLVGATPVNLDDMPPRVAQWLRLGIAAVAVLALIVSLYALSAIAYRTVLDRLTPNRLTFMGWNVINIGLLALVLLFQTRSNRGRWVQGLYRAYRPGTVAYAVWTIVVILALPWFFGINQGTLEALPVEVREVVYEHPNPILLKCSDSPHIYLLDRGEKRWIESIDVFVDRDYAWRDVRFVSCEALRALTDGAPIPTDAGPAPQP